MIDYDFLYVLEGASLSREGNTFISGTLNNASANNRMDKNG